VQLGKRIRFWFLGLLWVAVIIAMSVRLVYLAAYQRTFLLGQSKARVERRMSLTAKRGRILDRNGRVLAMSKPVNDVWTSPRLLLSDDRAIGSVAKVLNVSSDALRKRLHENQHRDFYYLSRNIDDDVGACIRDLKLPYVNLTQSFARFYPGGKACAQTVGIVNIDGDGLEGLEYLYDKTLSGESGFARYLINPFGETIESIQRKEPVAGEDIQLSIDRSIQYIAYEALKDGVKATGAKSALALVLDVRDGGIIAATGYPSYNPEVKLAGSNTRPLRHKVFTDLYEPGSTFKPIALAYILENSRFSKQSKIQTHPGELKIGTNIVKDVRNYGLISLDDVIVRSSNVAMSKLMLASSRDFIAWLKQRFLIGQKDVRVFPGEPMSAIVDKPNVSDFELATLSFGYGLSMTPLKLGSLYLTLANDGLYMPTYLVKSMRQSNGQQRVMRASTAREINQMLHKTTIGYGTARRARVSGINVAGKTGTTHVLENGAYQEDRYVASFAGFFPYESPKYVVVVIVEEPDKSFHFGGQAAAPIFSKIVFNSQFIS
tara:strand:- start:309 stop:1946 length:1638 start_codon:yes stop_codon:yes gene_type:complete